MKKIGISAMLIMTAALMTVACSKPEEPKVAESKLVGTWVAPLNVGGGTVEGVGGKELVINADHTAKFAVLSFNNWKIEGDVLTFTNYIEHEVDRELAVLRYTIDNFADTSMVLSGKYTYAVGDSIYLEGDMSGLYKRKVETPPAAK